MSVDAAQFHEALLLLREGKLTEAELIYREALAREPQQPDALHYLGVVAYHRRHYDEAVRLIGQALVAIPGNVGARYHYGNALLALQRWEDAIASYDRALALKPDFAEAHANRANALAALKRWDEAIAGYTNALAVKPAFPEALANRGNAFLVLKRFKEALASYDQALAVKPDFTEALSNRGTVLSHLGRWDEALASYDAALAVTPDFTEALYNCGNALLHMARLEDAVASYDRALVSAPDHVEALTNRGTALSRLERWEDAVASYDAALRLNPGAADTLYSRGNALMELQRPEEALASYDQALAIRPNFAAALGNRGNVLSQLDRFDEALASYDRALALDPAFAAALYNRGRTLVQLRRLGDATASYRQALALTPDLAEAHVNQSLCHLLAGDFQQGWQQYEWRWRYKPQWALTREYAKPLWLGDGDIAGKTVLLHAEQGFGDTLQFCRYAALVAERGARVVLEVQPSLKSLLASLDGVAEVIAGGEPLPDFDVHAPLMSLPLAFKTTVATIPARVPYLKPPAEAVARWQARVRDLPGPRIGVAWSGNPDHHNDRHRSIPARQFAPLLECGATVINLQKDLRAEDQAWLAAHPQIRNFGSELDGFADTAALTSLMDVVVSVDTSVAHLAGALGRPVWVLLPYAGTDWRWMLERDDSPWYPTARLYRQPAMHAWDSVIERATRDLQADAGD